MTFIFSVIYVRRVSRSAKLPEENLTIFNDAISLRAKERDREIETFRLPKSVISGHKQEFDEPPPFRWTLKHLVNQLILFPLNNTGRHYAVFISHPVSKKDKIYSYGLMSPNGKQCRVQ